MKWVCLMYHDVTARPEDTAAASKYFAVSRKVFDEQLDQLSDLAYDVLSIEDATRHETAGTTASHDGSHVIACSFDDGDSGQCDSAFPSLAKRGMAATFFITTDWVGRPGFVS